MIVIPVSFDTWLELTLLSFGAGAAILATWGIFALIGAPLRRLSEASPQTRRAIGLALLAIFVLSLFAYHFVHDGGFRLTVYAFIAIFGATAALIVTLCRFANTPRRSVLVGILFPLILFAAPLTAALVYRALH